LVADVDVSSGSLAVVPSVTAFCCDAAVVGPFETTVVPAENDVLACDVAPCCSDARLAVVLGETAARV